MVFIIIVLPLILSFALFNPMEEIPLENIKEGNTTYISVPEEYFHKSELIDSIRNVYGVPFDLQRYNLYFEGEGVYVNYPDGRVLENASFQIELNNKTINITEGKIPYGPIELEERYEYSMHILSQITFKSEYVIHSLEESEEKGITMSPSFKVYARPLWSDIIVRIILFVISWMSLCWLLTRICTVIYEK
ncbi:hypothetical protein C5S30_02410 [ANME-1 cluster archaeon GoMg4]|nr:hypothetical protein [ANME-1 cluster archaeon GoMg4]